MSMENTNVPPENYEGPTLDELKKIVFLGIMEPLGVTEETLPQRVIDAWFSAKPDILLGFIPDVKSALLNWEHSPRIGAHVCSLIGAHTAADQKTSGHCPEAI